MITKTDSIVNEVYRDIRQSVIEKKKSIASKGDWKAASKILSLVLINDPDDTVFINALIDLLNNSKFKIAL